MGDFFNKFKKTFDKGVNTVSIKSNTLMEINKVKGNIHTLNTNIQQQKSELSNKFYEMYLKDEIDVEACKEFCRNIKAYEEEIAQKEKEIEDIKSKEENLLAESNKAVEEKHEIKIEEPITTEEATTQDAQTEVNEEDKVEEAYVGEVINEVNEEPTEEIVACNEDDTLKEEVAVTKEEEEVKSTED